MLGRRRWRWLIPPASSSSTIFLLSLLLSSSGSVSADCECGYSYSYTTQPAKHHVFTEVTESNFARLSGEVSSIRTNTDWIRQAFNLTAEEARGDYGEMFAVENIQLQNDGGDGGLRLTVGSSLVQDMVPTAEIDTARMDMTTGTFRASIKLTGVPGTCAAFFWYYNDTQEIDMEFLSKDFNPQNKSYPVNLVLQSPQAARMGYDASKTNNFLKAYLPFDPTLDFHEYRIDYLPGTVFFYADGVLLAQMDGAAVPSSPGHLVLRHWSNGNKLWSGGPPPVDAIMKVRYVKAYFNSSAPQRHEDWARRCRDGGTGTGTAANSICRIPELTVANVSAKDWFFSEKGNMTNNQTIYGLDSGAAGRRQSGRRGAVWALILATGWWALMFA